MNPKRSEPASGDAAATPQAAGAAWLSVADAAALLGISARAVQKRADRGTLPARRVKYGDALRWEIDGRELNAGAGAKGSQDVRSMDGQTANFEREPVRKVGARRSQDGRSMDATGAALLPEREPTRREVEQQEEIRFLRATVEQLQRDGAEVRAALRAALKLAAPQSAPQLTAGDGSGDVAGVVVAAAPLDAATATASATRAAPGDSSARDAPASSGTPDGAQVSPERAQFKPPNPTTGDKSGAAPLTYNDIADQLERDLKARGL